MFQKKWAENIDLQFETIGNSVKVTQTSEDPCTIELIKVHASAVTSFVNNGIPEFLCQHKIPDCVHS